MRTLIEILSGPLNYNDNWGIYAELIDGEFKPESEARFGQRKFDNGGLPDHFVRVANNMESADWMADYLGLPERLDDGWTPDESDCREAAEEFIRFRNSQRKLED